MQNKLFQGATPEERISKLASILREYLVDALSEDQLQSLVSCIGWKQQHTLRIYSNSGEYTRSLAKSKKSDTAKVVFGQVGMSAGEQAGDRYCICHTPDEPSAVVIIHNNRRRCYSTAHIYVPNKKPEVAL